MTSLKCNACFTIKEQPSNNYHNIYHAITHINTIIHFESKIKLHKLKNFMIRV